MSAFSSSALMYSERPEWSDVKPLPQYEAFNPLAPIFYSDEYKDATNYFRAIVKLGETSNRVLDLTEDIIRLNPAHYSAWQYRYKTLLAINSPLDLELRLMDELAVTYLKTYQVWHHRRLLLTHISSLSSPPKLDVIKKELAFIEKCFDEDSKNYHTWSYRQWLLAHFNSDELWDGELAFIDKLLSDDIRNNSAWHHRFFVLFDAGVRTEDQDRRDLVRRETLFAKQKIAVAPNNTSAWNYLRGIFDRTQTPYSSVTEFVVPYTKAHTETSDSDVVDLEAPLPSAEAHLPCVPGIEFLADIYETNGEAEGIQKAVQLYRILADEHDVIRKKYWEFRIKEALQSI